MWITILILLCIITLLFGYIFLTSKAKAYIIFFGGILLLVIISGILVAIGIKAFFISRN